MPEQYQSPLLATRAARQAANDAANCIVDGRVVDAVELLEETQRHVVEALRLLNLPPHRESAHDLLAPRDLAHHLRDDHGVTAVSRLQLLAAVTQDELAQFRADADSNGDLTDKLTIIHQRLHRLAEQ